MVDQLIETQARSCTGSHEGLVHVAERASDVSKLKFRQVPLFVGSSMISTITVNFTTLSATKKKKNSSRHNQSKSQSAITTARYNQATAFPPFPQFQLVHVYSRVSSTKRYALVNVFTTWLTYARKGHDTCSLNTTGEHLPSPNLDW